MRALLPLAVVGAGLLWVDPAQACSPLPTGWSVGVGLSLRTGVPLEGVIHLSARYFPGYGASEGRPDLTRVTVTVVDASGTRVPGRLEYRADLEGLLWRANPRLEPNAHYDLTVRAWREDTGEQEQSLDLRTRAEPLSSLAPLEFEGVLTEREVPGELTCCNWEPDSVNCGYCGISCEQCRVTEYAYVPYFATRLTSQIPTAELLVLTPQVRVEGGEVRSRESVFATQPTVDLSAASAIGLAQHCLRIHALRVVDGAEAVGEWMCLDASALTQVPRRSGEPFDPERIGCFDEPRKILVDGTLAAAEGGCGCRDTAGGGSGGLALFAGLALLGARRRKTSRRICCPPSL